LAFEPTGPPTNCTASVAIVNCSVATGYRKGDAEAFLMRIGVLDVGSNSARLQVMDTSSGGAPPLPIYAVKEPTRLGEERGHDGVIEEPGLTRVIEAVARTLGAAQHWQLEQLYPFATAAIRDATNRDEVLQRVEAETGITLQTLSGEQEAQLTFSAVRRWYGWQAGRLLVVDIGGGTMELALGRELIPDVVVSLPLGAGHVTRCFLSNQPLGNGQVETLRKYVGQHLGEIADRLRWEGQPSRTIVTSKTFYQLARLCGAPKKSKGPFVRRTLLTSDLPDWIDRLGRTPVENRAKYPGISAARAWQILGGAVVAHETLRQLGIDKVELSPWALREGIVLEHLATLADISHLPLQPFRVESSAPGGGAPVIELASRSESGASNRSSRKRAVAEIGEM
jgi:exopolyphosphatase / guanosine-5'-triphosphate,3'-diphosphate pyrophosphatase